MVNQLWIGPNYKLLQTLLDTVKLDSHDSNAIVTASSTYQSPSFESTYQEKSLPYGIKGEA